MDFRKSPAPHIPITLCGLPLPFPGDHHYTEPQVGAKHQLHHQEQRLYFFQWLKKLELLQFSYILIFSFTICYATAKDKGRMQHIVHSAEKMIGCSLPSINNVYPSRTLKSVGKIATDPSHPNCFRLLPLAGGYGPSHYTTT